MKKTNNKPRLVGAMTQIADRLELREGWYFPHEANIEAQIRIILRQLDSLTLREMAVSFPWPTREMAGAEVLPIRSMRPEEKRRWLQQLLGLLSAEKSKDTAAARGRERNSSASNARFETPRPRSKSPLAPRSQSPRPETPPALAGAPPPTVQLETLSLNAFTDSRSTSSGPSLGSLRRSNATNNKRMSQPPLSESPPRPAAAIPAHVVSPERGPRRFSNSRNLSVPVPVASVDGSLSYAYLSDGEDYMSSGDELYVQPMPSTPGSSPPSRDGGLTRLLSVKRPNDSVLADAMSLALFRMNED
jgi:hypothetical protein